MAGRELTTVGAVLLACSACQRPPDADHLRMIDALAHRTDSLIYLMNGTEWAVYHRMDSTFRSERPGIEREFTDTLSPDAARTLGNYFHVMDGSLAVVIEEHPRVIADLAVQHEQLADLRHDVTGAIPPVEEEATAIEHERLAVERLSANVNTLLKHATNAMEAWEQYHARVDSSLHAPTSVAP